MKQITALFLIIGSLTVSAAGLNNLFSRSTTSPTTQPKPEPPKAPAPPTPILQQAIRPAPVQNTPKPVVAPKPVTPSATPEKPKSESSSNKSNEDCNSPTNPNCKR